MFKQKQQQMKKFQDVFIQRRFSETKINFLESVTLYNQIYHLNGPKYCDLHFEKFQDWNAGVKNQKSCYYFV